MAAINSRNKGAAGERELAGLIRDHLGVHLVRNLLQTRQGGCDLVVNPDQQGPVAELLRGFAIEVKRTARATESTIKGYWRQAVSQADEAGKLPVLAFREDRQGWRVMVPLSFVLEGAMLWDDWRYTAALTIEGFASVVRERAATVIDSELSK